MYENHDLIRNESEQVFLKNQHWMSNFAETESAVVKSFHSLNSMDIQKPDKRAHKRFLVQKGAFAVIRPKESQLNRLNRIKEMSLSQIACSVYESNPARFGQINNISISGLSFDYIDYHKNIDDFFELDILIATQDYYLNNIPFIIISDFKTTSFLPFDIIETRRIGVKFRGINQNHKDELNKFIKLYTACAVKKSFLPDVH